MDSWDAIKQICQQTRSVDPVVLDYIAVSDILELAVRGKSVKVIEIMTGFDQQYIRDTLDEFEFPVFEMNTKVDSREVYKRHRYNRYAFVQRMRSAEELSEWKLRDLFDANIAFDKIERKIEEYYAD